MWLLCSVFWGLGYGLGRVSGLGSLIKFTDRLAMSGQCKAKLKG